MMSANISRKKRQGIYRRDGFRCALCDSNHGLQIHHITPRSLGGTDNPANLITLCWKCHAAAHGTYHPDYPEYIDKDYIEQACVEYISDWYAEVLNIAWSPWEDAIHNTPADNRYKCETCRRSCDYRGHISRLPREVGGLNLCPGWTKNPQENDTTDTTPP